MFSTTPWDSYLIRTKIWSYPPNAIIGPTVFRIPAEEFFFFVIQTYNTSLLYLILNKPTFHPTYLRGEKLQHDGKRLRLWRGVGTFIMSFLTAGGAVMASSRGKGLYMGLILVWALPFALVLWYVYLSSMSEGLLNLLGTLRINSLSSSRLQVVLFLLHYPHCIYGLWIR